jgi:hypothetical protein
MSFGSPSIPQVQMPPPPTMAAPLQPASMKPKRLAMQPTFVGALDPSARQTAQAERTLIGGTPTALGA